MPEEYGCRDSITTLFYSLYNIYLVNLEMNAPAGPAGADGAPGQDGTTFTPHVSAAGVLSWTNDGGKQNPASVSIKGPAGAAGKDPEPFYVTCTLSGQDVYDEGATHDKSFAEILANQKCLQIVHTLYSFRRDGDCVAHAGDRFALPAGRGGGSWRWPDALRVRAGRSAPG